MTEPSPRSDQAALSQHFATIFGLTGSEFVVRAPGRANLIGEHIDYNGLPVLPMALERRVTLMAHARSDSHVRVCNEDGRFETVEFDLAAEVTADVPGHWGNYVKAAVRAMASRHQGLSGADVLVASNLPTAAGLSSSSALVVASALALLTANGLAEDPLALAEQMAAAEQFVGLRGGGMDQAVCLSARAGTASLIDFAPLRVEYLAIPSDWAFVVGVSHVPAEKSAGARALYNRRTEQCRIALRQVAALVGLGPDDISYPALLGTLAVEELLAAGREALEPELQRRFRHVVTEADRVRRAAQALEAADLDGFGDLLNASHTSLREDYAVSCGALDDLVEAARAGGAVGARLTGAGLGGSVIAVGPAGATGDILTALDDRYYSRASDGAVPTRFVARPASGATVDPLSAVL